MEEGAGASDKAALMGELDHLQMDEFNEFCDGLDQSNGH